MKNTLCIAEWQKFGIDDIEKCCGNGRAEKYFNELVEFIKQEGNDRFLGFVKSNYLKAKNHVGLIQTKSGFSLEILPKTFKANKHEDFENTSHAYSKDCKCKVCQAKGILLNMLKTLKDSPFKQSHLSNLEKRNMPLLEVFIIMFITELEKLVKRGIKSDYLAIEENRRFLKGKLLFKENLKYNLAHKERFYTLADEWSMAIAQNRLIVSTLNLLSTQSLSLKTSARLNQLRFIFDGIPPSKNIESDFAKCHNSRHFEAYKLIMLWCEIFLKRKVFSPYRGNSIAFALLFPMEQLFESYVASKIRKWLRDEKYEVKPQASSKYLIHSPNDKKDLFQLKPDIVISKKHDKSAILILDTKWKVLDSNGDKSRISQSDLYQMWAYVGKYKKQSCKNKAESSHEKNMQPDIKVILIYPQCEATKNLQDEWQSGKIWQLRADSTPLVINFFPLDSKDNESEEKKNFINFIKGLEFKVARISSN